MSAVENLLLDTNVLVYAHDVDETVKSPQAEVLLNQIFAAGQPLLTMQVLSEFYWAVTRKILSPLSHDEAVTEVARLHILARVVSLDWSILEKAMQAVADHGMPLWDAQIFAAASLNGAVCILSEDGQHRQTVEGITYLNPFAADFDVAEVLPP